MQNYLKYLETADPSTVDVYTQRSQILSYHNECSLASAEGSISSTLQTPNNPAVTNQPQTIRFSYTIPSNPTLAGVTSDFVSQFNMNADFKAEGVIASATSTPGVISFTMATNIPLIVSVTPPDHTETAVIDSSVTPQTLTIAQVLRANDVISLSAIPPKQRTNAAPIPGAANSPVNNTVSEPQAEPPAGLLGRPPGGTSQAVQ